MMLINQLLNLHVLHTFAEMNDMVYTLQAGSIISYYREGKPFFWDDDVDLVVRGKDFHHFHRIWESGTNERIQNDPKRDYMERDVTLLGVPMKMLRGIFRRSTRKGEIYDGWYKFRRTTSFGANLDVDIDRCIFDGKYCNDTFGIHDKWGNRYSHNIEAKENNFNFPTPEATAENFPVIDYCGVRVRMIRWEICKDWVDVNYPYWRDRLGPNVAYRKHLQWTHRMLFFSYDPVVALWRRFDIFVVLQILFFGFVYVLGMAVCSVAAPRIGSLIDWFEEDLHKSLNPRINID